MITENLEHWRNAKLGGEARYSSWKPKRVPQETVRLIAREAERLLSFDRDPGLELPGAVAEQLEAVADWLALIDEELEYAHLTNNLIRYGAFQDAIRAARQAFGGQQ